MATLDTLPPQRRAVIELLLRQHQDYDSVAATLDMPGGRVRELAREALSSLAPSTARRVDEDWRDQVADYVLGQQTGPESKATRGHLRRSEPARAWASSLLDSLDPLYGDGERPEVPEPGGAGADDGKAKARRRRGGAGAAAAGGAAAGAGAAAAAGEDAPTRDSTPDDTAQLRDEEASPEVAAGGQDAEPETTPGGDRDFEGAGAPFSEREESAGAPGAAPSRRTGGTRELSPKARAAVRRRRLAIGGVAAAVVAIALAIVLLGGDEDSGGGGSDRASRPSAPPQQQQQQQARLIGQAELKPQGGSDAKGVAVIAERTGQFQLLVQARGLEASREKSAYEVWLYNSQSDAQSLGGQVTDNDGNLQGAGPLPANFRNYRFVDISRERIDRNPDHSDESVLRIPVEDLLRGPSASGAAGGAPAP